MKTFQLDQNLNSGKVVRACNDEGHARAQRLPHSLKDILDPGLLDALMTEAAPLVTCDRRLPRDHSNHIPDANPGIVVVTNFPQKFPTMTAKIAMQILANFKTCFPGWHDAPVNNSIIEITAEGVEVYHVEHQILVRDRYFPFDAPDWPAAFLATLTANAGRGLLPP
jgi:hypothetical protein